EVTGITGLGGFGGSHIDKGDSFGGLSGLIPFSKLEAGIHPGLMFLLSLGVARELHPLQTIYMSGLRPHGGTSPTYNDNITLVETDNMRSLMIAYIPRSIFDGEGISALAALPNQTLLTVGPEMRGVNSTLPENTAWCEQATYAADGHALMDRRSHANYLVRDFYLLQQSILQQAAELGLHCDRDRHLTSWSYIDENNKRVACEPW
ncbi:hypothetical protein C8J57DRAFT_1024773, partial [Mycena rebaudengoi]